jgi:hypothetical protein
MMMTMIVMMMKVMVIVEHLVEEDFSGEIEVFGENLLQNHFDHHISHMS